MASAYVPRYSAWRGAKPEADSGGDAFVRGLDEQVAARRERDRQAKEHERYLDSLAVGYDPFGRAGAGAPIRDDSGNVVANLAHAVRSPPSNGAALQRLGGPLSPLVPTLGQVENNLRSPPARSPPKRVHFDDRGGGPSGAVVSGSFLARLGSGSPPGASRQRSDLFSAQDPSVHLRAQRESEYRQELQRQMQENELRKHEEKRRRSVADEIQAEQMRSYDPWGRPGAGAPAARGVDDAPIADLGRLRREGVIDSVTALNTSGPIALARPPELDVSRPPPSRASLETRGEPRSYEAQSPPRFVSRGYTGRNASDTSPGMQGIFGGPVSSHAPPPPSYSSYNLPAPARAAPSTLGPLGVDYRPAAASAALRSPPQAVSPVRSSLNNSITRGATGRISESSLDSESLRGQRERDYQADLRAQIEEKKRVAEDAKRQKKYEELVEEQKFQEQIAIERAQKIAADTIAAAKANGGAAPTTKATGLTSPTTGPRPARFAQFDAMTPEARAQLADTQRLSNEEYLREQIADKQRRKQEEAAKEAELDRRAEERLQRQVHDIETQFRRETGRPDPPPLATSPGVRKTVMAGGGGERGAPPGGNNFQDLGDLSSSHAEAPRFGRRAQQTAGRRDLLDEEPPMSRDGRGERDYAGAVRIPVLDPPEEMTDTMRELYALRQEIGNENRSRQSGVRRVARETASYLDEVPSVYRPPSSGAAYNASLSLLSQSKRAQTPNFSGELNLPYQSRRAPRSSFGVGGGSSLAAGGNLLDSMMRGLDDELLSMRDSGGQVVQGF